MSHYPGGTYLDINSSTLLDLDTSGGIFKFLYHPTLLNTRTRPVLKPASPLLEGTLDREEVRVMRRSSIIVSLAVLAVTIILFSAMPNWLTIGATQKVDIAEGRSLLPLGHPSAVGTWYFPSLADMVTYHEDGTLTANGFITQFASNTYSASSSHGVWFGTGSQSIKTVHFIKLQTLDNTQWRIWRVRTTPVFDEEFEQIIGGLVVLDDYECTGPFDCPNPLTDPPTTPNLFQGTAGPAFRVKGRIDRQFFP